MMVLEPSMKSIFLMSQTLLGKLIHVYFYPTFIHNIDSEYDNDDSVLVQDDEDEHEVTDDGKFRICYFILFLLQFILISLIFITFYFCQILYLKRKAPME